MTIKPYALASDIHLHNWNAFSHILPDGSNNRLRMLVDELMRACREVKAAGGDKLRIAGDLFHVRGSIAPSVMNVFLDFIVWAKKEGISIELIAGNHDLEGKHSDSLGSAVRTLTNYSNVKVIESPEINEDERVVMVPWMDDLNELRTSLRDIVNGMEANGHEPFMYDLIIHAPLNGVIAGLPEKGLTTAELQGLGFKRVFAGHYHNHKELAPNFAVTSIGAIAHHSWSDVNSKAGFLIVTDKTVNWRKSHCPDFVDVSNAESEEEALLNSDGNYVRASVTDAKTSAVEEMRKQLTDAGARGVVIRYTKDTSGVQRQGAVAATIKSGASIHQSVSEFVNAKHHAWAKGKVDELNEYCQKILAKAAV